LQISWIYEWNSDFSIRVLCIGKVTCWGL
jgi:hypothetical protein